MKKNFKKPSDRGVRRLQGDSRTPSGTPPTSKTPQSADGILCKEKDDLLA